MECSLALVSKVWNSSRWTVCWRWFQNFGTQLDGLFAGDGFNIFQSQVDGLLAGAGFKFLELKLMDCSLALDPTIARHVRHRYYQLDPTVARGVQQRYYRLERTAARIRACTIYTSHTAGSGVQKATP